MTDLRYYCHRWRDADPNIQAFNLLRARERFERARTELLKEEGVVLWAPWIAMAEAGVGEEQAWGVIRVALDASSSILVDCDGAPPSRGMVREMIMMDGDGRSKPRYWHEVGIEKRTETV